MRHSKKHGKFLKCGHVSPPCKPQIGDFGLSQQLCWQQYKKMQDITNMNLPSFVHKHLLNTNT